MNNTIADNTNNDSNYQDILNSYANKIEDNPSQDLLKDNIVESETESQITPDVLKEVAPVTENILPPTPPQEPIKPSETFELPPPPIIENNILPPQEPPVISQSTVPSNNNIFKYIFFVSLLVFLFVVGVVAYSIINIKGAIKTAKVSPTPTITPKDNVISSGCELNDKKYTVGESFKSADGCNTCSCQEDLSIVCTEMACTSTPTVTKSSTSSADLIKDWKNYEDKVVGFSFQYPKTYGDINISIKPGGSSGTFYNGTFSKNNDLSFGATSKDYLEERGIRFLDFSGYTNTNNSITFRASGKNWPIDSSAIKKIYKNKNGIEIVLITGFEKENFPSPFGLGDGNTGVLINTKNKTYSGIAFIANSKMTEAELLRILETFKLI